MLTLASFRLSAQVKDVSLYTEQNSAKVIIMRVTLPGEPTVHGKYIIVILSVLSSCEMALADVLKWLGAQRDMDLAGSVSGTLEMHQLHRPAS